MLSATLGQKAKILCTMGPAVASTEKVVAMMRAGANAFRLNMSHGSYTSHQHYIECIRRAEKQLGVNIPIVADLQGPKIRVGQFGELDQLMLLSGHDVRLADASVIKQKKLKIGDELIPVNYPTLAKDVKKGDILLLDDGLLKLQVKNTNGEIVTCIVVHGGILKPRKGINLPQTSVSQPAMTTKDRADVRFAIEQDCDFIALSFVRTASDVENVRRYINKYDGAQHVIAKIEKPEALANIEDIIRVSDAIMVARGDLGVEIPAQNVPLVQKNIIKLCNEQAKPVITATQMLESMIRAPRPTRAEASDVANAVIDGTDGVMLSGETSVGAYPIEAVHYMRLICAEAEQVVVKGDNAVSARSPKPASTEKNTDAIAAAAAHIAEDQRISGIVTLSYSGETARLISNRRPHCPILGITSVRSVARRMQLYWGVTGLVNDTVTTTDETIENVKDALVKEKILPASAYVVFTIGRPLMGKARTNMLSIERLSS